MTEITAIAIFCEDIRQETAGGQTIVGAMRDNLALSSLPGAMPKLGIFVRINIKLNTPVHAALIYIALSTGERTLVGQIDSSVVEDALRLAGEEGAPEAGVNTSIIATNFPVQQPMRVTVELEYDGNVSTIGWLNFQQGTQPER